MDLTEIGRIEAAMNNPRFLTKVFSKKEQQLLFERKNSPAVAAANFAGKEAFSKALGTGFRRFSPAEVEILRDDLGCPYVSLLGRAKTIAEQKGIVRLHISLTHTNDCAGAFVIAET